MRNAVLADGGFLQVPSAPALGVGNGDFTVLGMFATRTGGPVVARIALGSGGFALTVGPDSRIVFLTSDGQHTHQVATGLTAALDGGCHTVAGIRRGTTLSIVFDGRPLDVTETGAQDSPLDVDNDLPLLLGASAAGSTIAGLAGTLMNVGLCGSAQTPDGLLAASFARVNTQDEALRGYWTLNGTVEDLSRYQNTAIAVGSVSFQPCVDCVWTTGNAGFAFCQMANAPTPEQSRDSGLAAAGPITQTREIVVTEGAPALYASIMAQADEPAFPDGVQVRITGPDGTVYDRDANTDTLFVTTRGGQPWAVAVVTPQAGSWRMTVTAPPTVGFVLQFQVCPRDYVVTAISSALAPLFGTTEPLDPPSAEDLPAAGWSGFLARTAVAALVGVAVAALVALGGGGAAPAITAGLAVFATTGLAQAGAALTVVNTGSLTTADVQVGGMAGFVVATEALLLIDANVEADQATQLIYKRRRAVLYPYVDASPFNTVQRRVIGADDRRTRVRDELLGFAGGYVSASGHGRPNYLTGWYVNNNPHGPLEEVLTRGHYAPAEAAGKIIHIFGCHCGYEGTIGLGRDLVAHGAAAFFGYSEAFVLPPSEYPTFCDCDIEIDKQLIDGETCATAYSRAYAKYTTAIARYRVDGDDLSAAQLEKNRNLLVAPSTNPMFGDPQARLDRGAGAMAVDDPGATVPEGATI